jgi:hypothetical protein
MSLDSKPRVGDRCFRLDPGRVLELVNHVPVAGQRQAYVVTELTRDVDDTASLVQQQVTGAGIVTARSRPTLTFVLALVAWLSERYGSTLLTVEVDEVGC